MNRGEKELKCLQWNPKTLCYQSSYLKSHVLWIDTVEKPFQCWIQCVKTIFFNQLLFCDSFVILWLLVLLILCDSTRDFFFSDIWQLFTIIYVIYYNFPINLCSYLHCCYFSHFRLKTSYHRISVDMFQVILERNLLNACSSILSVLIIDPSSTCPNIIFFFSILDWNFSNACSVQNLLSRSHLAWKDMF